MIILITGHTKGIGLALHDMLVTKGHTVIGCSRSNDFNIATTDGRDAIISLLHNVDVFINCAYAQDAQALLALQAHKSLSKFDRFSSIINIGSRAAYDHPLRSRPLDYDYYKIGLRDISHDLSRIPGNVRTSHVAFGYVDVTSVSDKQASKISVETVLNIITYLIELPHDVQIREICIEAR